MASTYVRVISERVNCELGEGLWVFDELEQVVSRLGISSPRNEQHLRPVWARLIAEQQERLH